MWVSRPVPGVGPEMLQEPATDMAGVSFMSGPARPALAIVGVSPGSVGGSRADSSTRYHMGAGMRNCACAA
jgi:hypothetical protein